MHSLPVEEGLSALPGLSLPPLVLLLTLPGSREASRPATISRTQGDDVAWMWAAGAPLAKIEHLKTLFSPLLGVLYFLKANLNETIFPLKIGESQN